MTGSFAGGCLCGAVRYVAAGPPLNVRICHCRTCQHVTGSAFFARALFPADQVTITGEIAVHASSPLLLRVFCPVCGATLGTRRDTPGGRTASISLGTLDDPDALPPSEHIFVTRKMAWLTLADGLPQHDEWASA